MVCNNQIKYDLKFCERTQIDKLFTCRGHCDDIRIVKNGMITHSSKANIIFFNGREWLTPKKTLLNGTCRQRLLEKKEIKEIEINVNDLKSFQGFKLINAMIGSNTPMIPIEKIIP